MIRRRMVLAAFAAAAGLAHAQAPDVAHFDVYADGDTLHLLVGYGRKGEPSIALYHHRSADGGRTWGPAVRVSRDGDRLSAHHPGENPQIAASGDRVVVVRTAPPEGARRGGFATLTFSDDGGRSWHAGPAPLGEGAGTQTFMEIAAVGKRLHMVWLERRDRQQSLRYAQSPDLGATWSAARMLAPRTCDCCWNSLAVGPDGAVSILFRGGEPRDMMHVASRDGAAWRHTGPIGGFDWRFEGCPHVGGALAHAGGALHALVWTGKDGASGLYYARSSDGGGAWTTPRRMGTPNAKNGDLAAAPDGTLAAVWDEPDGGRTALFTARSADAGATWSAPEPVAGAGAQATNPRIAANSRGVALFWLEGSPWKGGRLKVNGAELPRPQ